MKFWKKIFLYSVLLTMILINGVGIIIIEKVHKNSLETSIMNAINDEKNIVSAINLSIDASTQIEYGFDRWLDILLKNYIYDNINNVKNIEILNEKNQIITSLSNFAIGSNVDEFLDINEGEFKFIIRTIENEKILSVISKFSSNKNNYKLILYRNIQSVYEEKNENYKIFIIIDIIINLLLIIGMYKISKHVTKPIDDLTNTSIHIANGEYNRRVKTKSNDEFGVLSKNFNIMVETLQGKIRELEETNEQQERFINNLTHEMKTPITSIMGYSDLLLKGNVDDNIKLKSLEYINNQGRRLENLSSSLMKLIMIKKTDVEKKQISLKNSIKDAIYALNYKIEDKNIKLSLNLEDGKILGDKQLIVVLFINLIENSIKACKHNGNISIEAKNSDTLYEVFIKDDGIGIKKEDLKKIIEPFYMADKSRGKANNGLGLGLAICKQICDMHNIELKIDSSLGQGTEIKLTINMEMGKNEIF